MSIGSLQSALHANPLVSQFSVASGPAGGHQAVGVALAGNITDVSASVYVMPRSQDGSVPRSIAHGLLAGDAKLVTERFRQSLKRRGRRPLWGDTHVTKIGPEQIPILNVVGAGFDSTDNDYQLVLGTTYLALLEARQRGFRRVVFPSPEIFEYYATLPMLVALESFWHDVPNEDPNEVVIVAQDESAFEGSIEMLQSFSQMGGASTLLDDFAGPSEDVGTDRGRNEQTEFMRSAFFENRFTERLRMMRGDYDRQNPRFVIGPQCSPLDPVEISGHVFTSQDEMSALVRETMTGESSVEFKGESQGRAPQVRGSDDKTLAEIRGAYFARRTAGYNPCTDTMYLDPEMVLNVSARRLLEPVFRGRRRTPRDHIFTALQHEWAHLDMGLMLSAAVMREIFRSNLRDLEESFAIREDIAEVHHIQIGKILVETLKLGIRIAGEAVAYNYERDREVFRAAVDEFIDEGTHTSDVIGPAMELYDAIGGMIKRRGKRRTLRMVRKAASLAFLNGMSIFSFFGIRAPAAITPW